MLFPPRWASTLASCLVAAFLPGCARESTNASRSTPHADVRSKVADAAASKATPTHTSASASPTPVRQRRYQLRQSEASDPSQFSAPNSAVPAAPPPPAKPAPDGCKRPMVIEMQGYQDEAPIRGTLELRDKQVKARTFNLKTQARGLLQGTLEPGMCENHEFVEAKALSLQSASGSPKVRYNGSLMQNSYFEVDRNRMRLELTEADASYPTFELWDTEPSGVPLRDRYQKALMNSGDVEAVVPGNDGVSYLAYLTVKERALVLAELKGSPPKLGREIVTDMNCDLHECGAALAVFSVNANLTVLVPTISGENCGAKCTRSARAAVWTLTPDGFHQGAHFSEAVEMMGGIDYSGSSSQTSVVWVDGDGAEPLEMLVESSATDSDDVSRSIVGYDVATQAYSISEDLPATPRESVDPFKRGQIVSY